MCRVGLFSLLKVSLINNAHNFPARHFFRMVKCLVKIVRSSIVFVLEMLTDDGIFVLLHAKMEVTARVTYTICIARITFKFKHSALVYQ